MPYRHNKRGRGSALVIVVAIIVSIMHPQGWSSSEIFNAIVISLILVVVAYMLYRPTVWLIRTVRRSIQKRRLRRIARSNVAVDDMTWAEFEYFVADWLKDRGYTNIRLTEHYDLGVDIVAKKDGITWGVQVKHYSGLVGINAVRQVVVALKKYKCDRAMVVTNSRFSRPAIEIANSHDCVLIDGSGLW